MRTNTSLEIIRKFDKCHKSLTFDAGIAKIRINTYDESPLDECQQYLPLSNNEAETDWDIYFIFDHDYRLDAIKDPSMDNRPFEIRPHPRTTLYTQFNPDPNCVSSVRSSDDSFEILILNKCLFIISREIRTVEIDVSSTSSVKNAIDQLTRYYNKIDLVYLNAAIYQKGNAADLMSWDADSQLAMFDINSLGPIRVVQSLLLNKLLQNSTILFISSGASIISNAEPYASTHSFRSINLGYNMSKAAMNIAAMTIKGICFNDANIITVDPGWMRTRMGGCDATDDPKVTAQKLSKLAISKQSFDSLVDADGNTLPW